MSTRKVKESKCANGIASNIFDCAKTEFDEKFDVAIFPKGMSIYHGSTALASKLIAFPVGIDYFINIAETDAEQVSASIIANDNEDDIAAAISEYGNPTAGWFADPYTTSLYGCKRDEYGQPMGEGHQFCCRNKTVKGIRVGNCILAYKFKENTKIIRLDTPRNIKTFVGFARTQPGANRYIQALKAFFGDEAVDQSHAIDRISARTHDNIVAELLCGMINQYNAQFDANYQGYGAPPLHSNFHGGYNAPLFHHEIVLCNSVKTLYRDYTNPIDWQYEPPSVEMNIVLQAYIQELNDAYPANYDLYSGNLYENAVWCSIFSQWVIEQYNVGYRMMACLIFFYNYRELYTIQYYNYINNTDNINKPFDVTQKLIDRSISLPRTLIQELLVPLTINWQNPELLYDYIVYLNVYWNIRDRVTGVVSELLDGNLAKNDAIIEIINIVYPEVGRQRLINDRPHGQCDWEQALQFVIITSISDLCTRGGFPRYANPINQGNVEGNLYSFCFAKIKNVSKILYPGSNKNYTEPQVLNAIGVLRENMNRAYITDLVEHNTRAHRRYLRDKYIYDRLFTGFLNTNNIVYSGDKTIALNGTTIIQDNNMAGMYDNMVQRAANVNVPRIGGHRHVIQDPYTNIGNAETKNTTIWWWDYYMARQYEPYMRNIQKRLYTELPSTVLPDNSSTFLHIKNRPTKLTLVKNALYMVKPIMKIIFEEFSSKQYPNLLFNPPRINHGTLNHMRSLYFTAFTMLHTNIIDKYQWSVYEIFAVLLSSVCKSIGRTNESGLVATQLETTQFTQFVNQILDATGNSSYNIRTDLNGESLLPIKDGQETPYIDRPSFTIISAFIQLQVFTSAYQFPANYTRTMRSYLVLAMFISPTKEIGYDYGTSGPNRQRFIDLCSIINIGHYLDHCRPTTRYSQLDPIDPATDPADPNAGKADPWISEFLIRSTQRIGTRPTWLDIKKFYYKEQKELMTISGFIPSGAEDIPINENKHARCANAFIGRRPNNDFAVTSDFVELSADFDLAWDTIIKRL